MNALSFGEWLKRQRKAAGFTQEQLADEVGCSTIAIRKMEAEERRPSEQIAERLAVIFNIPLEEQKSFLRFARGRIESAVRGVNGTIPWQDQVHDSLNNLPAPLTSFIGREKEVLEIMQRLEESRLVTLKGPGGVGKTRLAIRVANQIEEKFKGGIFWVDLAPLTDGALIPQAVAKALGLQEIASQSLNDILISFMSARQILLVLDNCEHLIEGCIRFVGDVLSACPQLKILATSREILGVDGEDSWAVPALSLPKLQKISLADLLMQYEGIRLFVERASAAKSGFNLTDQNAAGIVQICLRLDGIPLAIELAAARVAMMSISEIANRLDDRFSLLTAGSRAAMPRHQTLRAAIDWSYELLTLPEQILFRRLAIFTGGFTLEATEAITSENDLPKQTIINLLGQLINKSLVTVIPRSDGELNETRYGMLETIHEYASEKLREAGEIDQVFERYCEYFIELAEKAEPKLKSAEQLEWLARLDTEYENFRSLLQKLQTQRDAKRLLDLTSSLYWFWFRRTYFAEGRIWIERTLDLLEDSEMTEDKAISLFGAANLARAQGDFLSARKFIDTSLQTWQVLNPPQVNHGFYEASAFLAYLLRDDGAIANARSMLEECVESFRRESDLWNLAWSLMILGLTIRDQEDYMLASSIIEESISLWRKLGEDWGLAEALHHLTLVAYRQRKYEIAFSLMEEILEIRRRMGDKHSIAYSIHNLGVYSLAQGKIEQARSFFEKDLLLYEEVGDKSGVVLALQYQGLMARWDGDMVRAYKYYKEGLKLAQETGPIWVSANYWLWIADLAVEEGHFGRAVIFCSAARKHLDSSASFWDAFESSNYERIISLARTSLGDDKFALFEKMGQSISFEEAVALALK